MNTTTKSNETIVINNKPVNKKEKIMNDDERKFLSMVYVQYYKLVKMRVTSSLINGSDCEDVISDVFIKIKKLNEKENTKFDENRAKLITWVYNITTSVIRDYIRTNHQDKYISVNSFLDDEGNDSFDFVAGKQLSAENLISNIEIKEKITKAINTLKPSYRKIAILYFLWEMTYQQIVEIVDMPIGTVKGIIFKSKQLLQHQLKELYLETF